MNSLQQDPHSTQLAAQSASSLPVPAGFAEKAMASLMQLHGELMEEKERRVELYRRLMEKEQAVAELRMYVGMLEERLGHSAPAAAAVPPPEPQPSPEPPQPLRTRPSRRQGSFTPAPKAPPRPPSPSLADDGWKVW